MSIFTAAPWMSLSLEQLAKGNNKSMGSMIDRGQQVRKAKGGGSIPMSHTASAIFNAARTRPEVIDLTGEDDDPEDIFADLFSFSKAKAEPKVGAEPKVKVEKKHTENKYATPAKTNKDRETPGSLERYYNEYDLDRNSPPQYRLAEMMKLPDSAYKRAGAAYENARERHTKHQEAKKFAAYKEYMNEKWTPSKYVPYPLTYRMSKEDGEKAVKLYNEAMEIQKAALDAELKEFDDSKKPKTPAKTPKKTPAKTPKKTPGRTPMPNLERVPATVGTKKRNTLSTPWFSPQSEKKRNFTAGSTPQRLNFNRNGISNEDLQKQITLMAAKRQKTDRPSSLRTVQGKDGKKAFVYTQEQKPSQQLNLAEYKEWARKNSYSGQPLPEFFKSTRAYRVALEEWKAKQKKPSPLHTRSNKN
jgi:hypothetical protein